MQIIMLLKDNFHNKLRGFTLLEVLISIVILMVGMMGLFQSVNLALNVNIENQLRHQAVIIAEKTMSDQKKLRFTNMTASNSLGAEKVALGSVFRNMSVAHRIDDLAVSNTNTKQISVRVWWHYKNKLYEHQTSSSVGNVEN